MQKCRNIALSLASTFLLLFIVSYIFTSPPQYAEGNVEGNGQCNRFEYLVENRAYMEKISSKIYAFFDHSFIRQNVIETGRYQYYLSRLPIPIELDWSNIISDDLYEFTKISLKRSEFHSEYDIEGFSIISGRAILIFKIEVNENGNSQYQFEVKCSTE